MKYVSSHSKFQSISLQSQNVFCLTFLHVSLYCSLAMNFGRVLTLNLALSLLEPKGMLSIYIQLKDFTNNCSAFKTSVYFLNIYICNEKLF